MRSFWHIKVIFFSLALALEINTYAQIHVSGSLCTATPTQDLCLSPTLFFDMNTDATINSWQWDFGNGKTSNERNAQTGYPTAGSFTVKLNRFRNGSQVSSDTKIIEITDFNQPLLKGKEKGKYDDKCSGPLKLDPYEGKTPPKNAKYKWFPEGETTRTIEVENSGCYSVEVTNEQGCSKIAQIEVDFCLGNPNASSSKPVWYFGYEAGIEFGPVYPKDTLDCDDPNKFCYLIGEPGQEPEGVDISPITEGNKMSTSESSAMAFNISGELVLYSNGRQIFDKNDTMVPGGSSLSGSDNLPQSTVIVPKRTCNECPNHYYYVITLSKTTGVLSYNLVDIRGAKQVVEPNITLATNMAGRITSIETPEGYRIITHEANNGVFKFFDIDKKGIKETVQIAGGVFASATSNDGTMKVSNLGSKMAVAIVENGKNYVDVYDLSATGGLSNYKRIDLGSTASGQVYGLEFSPQEPLPQGAPQGTPAPSPRYLYASVGSQIIQISVATGAVKPIFTDPFGSKIGAMKIAPPQEGFAKYIVFAREGESAVGKIDFPETANPKVDAKAGQTRGLNGLGLPEITQPQPKSAGAGLQLRYKGRCSGSPTLFIVQPMCQDKGKAIYFWDFGDGSKFITYAIPAVTHTYQTAGDFKLKLRIKIPNCGEREYESSVMINPSPEINLAALVKVCDLPTGIFIETIDPKVTGGEFFTYAWVRGLGTNLGTAPTITVNALDKYTVQIKNEKKCVTKKEFEVKRICDPLLFVPDVFTPNPNDLSNERFRFFPYFMTNVKIRIYDRWGKQVFAKEQPASIPVIVAYDVTNIDTLREMFWNGKYDGTDIECPAGVYAYEIEFIEEFTIRKLTKTQKGSVLLIRE